MDNKIRPEELRIGNLLQLNPKLDWYPGNDLMVVVESISGHGINFGYYPETGLYWKNLIENDIVAIPLTEEWLIRGGYEKIKGSFYTPYYIIDEAMFHDQEGNKRYNFRKRINEIESISIKYLKFVHQLQNIHFELDSKELKFNDPST